MSAFTEVNNYIFSIRNKYKKAYACAYRNHKFNQKPFPTRPQGLGLMGAQAVEIWIEKILKK